MRRSAKVIVSLLLAGLMATLTGAVPAERRAFVSGRYALELDGVFAGWVQSAEGGHAVSDVVTERLGPDYIVKKHIGNVKYEEITVKVGTGMSKAFYQWIADTMEGKPGRKNGSIVTASYDMKEMSRLNFTHAIITEIGMPALDASSKNAAYITVKFKPEITRLAKGTGERVKAPVTTARQKQWLPANFRLRIDGLEPSMTRVNKIEAITIKQKFTEDAVGEWRDYEREPASLEIPNLVITLAESHADAMYDYFEDFVIRGNNAEDKEKGGTLEYLSPDLKEVLFKLEFRNLGIFKLTPDKVEAGSEQLRRVKAEMYCEDIRFSFSPAAAF